LPGVPGKNLFRIHLPLGGSQRDQKPNKLSNRIKEEFENGKVYYRFHGKSVLYLPEEIFNQPKTEFIQWHNENVYKG
jgi:hypothetical protein